MQGGHDGWGIKELTGSPRGRGALGSLVTRPRQRGAARDRGASPGGNTHSRDTNLPLIEPVPDTKVALAAPAESAARSQGAQWAAALQSRAVRVPGSTAHSSAGARVRKSGKRVSGRLRACMLDEWRSAALSATPLWQKLRARPSLRLVCVRVCGCILRGQTRLPCASLRSSRRGGQVFATL